jgi:hypothetical protein
MTRKEKYVWQPMIDLGSGKPGVGNHYYKIPGSDRRVCVYDDGHVDIEMDRTDSDGDSRTRALEQIA